MRNRNFTPFPILTTQRLLLRQLQAEDDQALFAIRSNPEVNKYLDRPPAFSIQAVQAFIDKIQAGIAQNEWVYWAIITEDKLIGTICLWNFSETPFKAEIGFELHPNFQKKGFMQEALEVVLKYGFNRIGLICIDGYTAKQNAPSIKFMEKNGFVKKQNVEKEGTVIYTLEKKKYTKLVPK
jgi:ribosomal-protein-alanine N-acetyltransferase